MNERTLIGQLVTDDGMARRARWHQPEPEMVGPLTYRARPAELRTDYFRIDRHRTRPVQPDWIGVTVGHSHDALGHVEHLEQRDQGLWLVAELACAPPPELRYISPAWYDRADGIEFSGAALVDEPAQICMQPVTVLPGPLADCDARRLPRWQAEMLDHAKTAAKHRRGGPVLVTDTAPTLTRTASRQVEHRSAVAVDVHKARREIDMLIVPAETETMIFEPDGRQYVEVVSRGAFAGVERQAEKIRLNRDHVRERLLGWLVTADPWAPAGLEGTARLARTALADEALALIADDLLGVSAGIALNSTRDVEWRGRGHRRIRRAQLDHVSLVVEAAYPTAAVTAVRATSRTPNLDAVLAGL